MKNPQTIRVFSSCSIVVASLLAMGAGCFAQAQNDLPDEPKPQPEVTLRSSPRNILHDQAAIWTSPIHAGPDDVKLLLPLAVATGAAIATDYRAMNDVVSKNPNFNRKSLDASNAMIGGFIAAPVALYGFGHFKENPRAREAGILSGEAMIDGVVVEQGMKLVFWRERPTVDNGKGHFFESSAGIDGSFPSSHSVVAWSAAAVLAGEYPSRWSQLFIYSAATGVSLTRVMGQQHFPSDVLIGSAAGWLVGRYVFHAHQRHAPRDDDDY